jgi:hypothetical protein
VLAARSGAHRQPSWIHVRSREQVYVRAPGSDLFATALVHSCGQGGACGVPGVALGDRPQAGTCPGTPPASARAAKQEARYWPSRHSVSVLRRAWAVVACHCETRQARRPRGLSPKPLRSRARQARAARRSGAQAYSHRSEGRVRPQAAHTPRPPVRAAPQAESPITQVLPACSPTHGYGGRVSSSML